MKTKNKVQNGILKSLAVAISVVLVSFTVSAQDFWETLLESNTFNEIALALIEGSSETSISEARYSETAEFVKSLEVEVEETLELENWMTNDANFFTFTIDEAVENTLEIEEWMTSDAYFTISALDFEVEYEETLEIENWMVNNENFEVSASEFNFEKEMDSELALESWMTNEKVWNNE